MFTDMTDTMLKDSIEEWLLRLRPENLENNLVNRLMLLTKRNKVQWVIRFLPYPSYINTVPRKTSMGIPIAESTPVLQMGPMLYRPTPILGYMIY